MAGMRKPSARHPPQSKPPQGRCSRCYHAFLAPHAAAHPQRDDATANALAIASQAEVDALLEAELAETVAQTRTCVLNAGHTVHLAVGVKRGDSILHLTSMTGITLVAVFSLGQDPNKK